jgi:hypothetical protein
MASSSRKKTTMAKLNREAAVRERRQRKKMRKDARKQAALDGTPLDADTVGQDEDLSHLDRHTPELDGDTSALNSGTAAQSAEVQSL